MTEERAWCKSRVFFPFFGSHIMMFQSSLMYPNNFDFVLAEHDGILQHLRGELSPKHYCFVNYHKQKLGLTHSNCPRPFHYQQSRVIFVYVEK